MAQLADPALSELPFVPSERGRPDGEKAVALKVQGAIPQADRSPTSCLRHRARAQRRGGGRWCGDQENRRHEGADEALGPAPDTGSRSRRATIWIYSHPSSGWSSTIVSIPAELAQPLGAVAEAEAARLDAAERRLDAQVVEERVVHAERCRLRSAAPAPAPCRRPPTRRCPTGRAANRWRSQRLLAIGRRASPARRAEGLLAHDRHLRVASAITWREVSPGPGPSGGRRRSASRAPGRRRRRSDARRGRSAARSDGADVDGHVARRRRAGRAWRRRPISVGHSASEAGRRPAPRPARARCGCRPGRCRRTRSRRRRGRRAADRRRRGRSSPTCPPARAPPGTRRSAAAAATCLPTAGLPVKKIMSAAAIERGARVAAARRRPAARPRAGPRLPQRAHAQRRERRRVRRLQHDGVAGRRAGRRSRRSC